MHSHNDPDRAVAAENWSALAAVLTFSPCPYNRFHGQPIGFRPIASAGKIIVQHQCRSGQAKYGETHLQ